MMHYLVKYLWITIPLVVLLFCNQIVFVKVSKYREKVASKSENTQKSIQKKVADSLSDSITPRQKQP